MPDYDEQRRGGSLIQDLQAGTNSFFILTQALYGGVHQKCSKSTNFLVAYDVQSPTRVM
ncbi:hypothetical protein HC762_00080, partial [bacterium]|nr:hypothetical protein [bacterium]